MGVSNYPILQTEIIGVEPNAVDGKSLGRNVKTLEAVAAKLGVIPLMSFFGADMGEFLAAEGITVNKFDTKSKWFEASDGIKTISTLLKYIEENPNDFSKTDKLVKDLRDFENVLHEAEKHKVKWHLAIDF